MADLSVGDIIEVHFITFAGPDLWIPAEITSIRDNSFCVRAVSIKKLFPGNYEYMAIPLGDKVQRWRKS